jgi:hypothetical protein
VKIVRGRARSQLLGFARGQARFREDAIYFDYSGGCHAAQHHRGCLDCGAARCRWATGADGKRVRRKVFGRTRQDVKDKLDGLHSDLDAGIRRPGSRYPVATHSTRTVAVIHNALERAIRYAEANDSVRRSEALSDSSYHA